MRTLSAADYFAEALIANGVTDVYGYQGGMIAYIFDSLGRYRDKISYHSCGTEQGAAFAACGYAQATGKLGVAISTSGPGFTNLLTGMANAWFDSLPVLFVSGNVNTKDKLRDSAFRQNGFQEIQAAQMARPITKKSVEVELDTDFVLCLSDAIATAMDDRMGPVYLDLPINICRETIEFETIEAFAREMSASVSAKSIIEGFESSVRPVIIAGAGIRRAGQVDTFRKLVDVLDVPVVTTMPGVDLLPGNNPHMMGYIGGTARREAGIVLQNADYVLSLGTRLCSKQVGHDMKLFAPKANRFIRVDVDDAEFERKLKPGEIDLQANLRTLIMDILDELGTIGYEPKYQKWTRRCAEVKRLLAASDMTPANQMFRAIGELLPGDANVILDVGKNLNYACQSMAFKEGTMVFMSAGLGSMGYAMPAAIGAYHGNYRPTFAFMGDGGAQMNIQELNTIARNKLPVKLFVFNNHALGNIRIFQESYLGSRFVATTETEGDYFSCDFTAIAGAYGVRGMKLDSADSLHEYQDALFDERPALFEINYEDCPALPGIVAGGSYLETGNGLEASLIERVCELMGGVER